MHGVRPDGIAGGPARLDEADPFQSVKVGPWTYLRLLARLLYYQSLPLRWSLALAAFVSGVKLRIRPRRRERLEQLLKPLLPAGISHRYLARQIAIARSIRRVGAYTYAPVFRRSGEWLLRTFRPEGLEYMKEVMASGRGAVIIGTHAGLNAWAAPILRRLGYPVRLMQRATAAKETLLLMRWDRVVSDVLPYPRVGEEGIHLKRLHDLIKAGVWIQHVGDYPDSERGLRGKYLGCDVCCRQAPWALAQLSGVPLLPVLVLVDHEFRVKLVVGPPIHVDRTSSARQSREAAFQSYLDFVNRRLSGMPWNLGLKNWEKLTSTTQVRRGAG